MAPIRNDQLEKDEAVPKLLSTLVLHDGAVLCVRWSPDGQLLASGSDDTKVVIWQYDATSRSAFGTSPSIENYRAVKVLMGHESGLYFD
jgi:protein HIRA/HIR1